MQTPWNIYSTAREFRRAFELCYGNGTAYESGVRMAPIAGIVNLVFAIELGLKAVHAADGEFKFGHTLSKLVESLRTDSRREVVDGTQMKEEEFSSELALVSNAFVEWRYIHEGPALQSINVDFLGRLWASIDAAAHRREELARAVAREKAADANDA